MGLKITLEQVGGWDELVRLRADKQSLMGGGRTVASCRGGRECQPAGLSRVSPKNDGTSV